MSREPIGGVGKHNFRCALDKLNQLCVLQLGRMSSRSSCFRTSPRFPIVPSSTSASPPLSLSLEKTCGSPLHSPSLKPVLEINLFVEFQPKNNFMFIGEDVCPQKEYENSGFDPFSNSSSAKMWIFISTMLQGHFFT